MAIGKGKLTLKQKMFCDWYIKLGGSRHGTEAAIKAGYSEKTAHSIATENLNKPAIEAYINKRQREIADLLGINKFTIADDFLKIRDMSMKAVPVMFYNPKTKQMEQKQEEVDGKMVGVYTFDSNGANRALENINKMFGYNEPEKTEDVTPPEKKVPTAINIIKNYAPDTTDKPTT